MKRIITFGTFDLLHQGHLRILERARALGDYLIVGVSTDRLNADKGKRAFLSQEQRLSCVAALKYVDEVFLEDSLDLKDEYIKEHKADILVMGDDWQGKFDWVSCEVVYLPRTAGVSSTESRLSIADILKCKKVLFGDTYVKKHYDCALSIVNELTDNNIAPIFTTGNRIPNGIDCNCIVYFNRPVNDPPTEYDSKPRVLVDHGASNLKWFLANQSRYNFFDVIVTAGPAHSRSLMAFFDQENKKHTKVRSAGFIKAKALLSPPRMTREEVARACRLDPARPITFFAPTWHISANVDMGIAIKSVASIDNHVASLHPETAHLDVSALNIVENVNGITTELLKHADCVISDTSSTIFEAVALGKPVVQISLREYSDNNSVLFDFPYTAGTAELFCGGLMSRPEEVADKVGQIYSGDEHTAEFISLMAAKVLEGTKIEADSSEGIVAEIARACGMKRDLSVASDRSHDHSLRRVHDNLFFARNRLIAHGGGDFEKHHASNSAEAIKAALNAVDVVELDFVLGQDGLIVAHDQFEPKYGLDKPFSDTNCDEFSSLRFGQQLHTLSAEEAIQLCARSGKALVCDVKSTKDDYRIVAEKIHDMASRNGVLNRVILQCYCLEDFKHACRIGFERTLLAVWKYFYRNPVGPEAEAFVEGCMAFNSHSIVGISVPYINRHLEKPSYEYPAFNRFFRFWKRLYIHGAPFGDYPAILRRNLGLFADGYSLQYQFKDAVAGFNWREYLFLNPGLIAAGCDNEIAATVHYLRFGRTEKRLLRYAVPGDFRHMEYVDVNPDLRKGGISGVDSARAHWTRYGSSEGRKYRR